MKEKKPGKKSNNTRNNFARFSGIAFQMGATIFLAAYAGKWLDGIYPSSKKWFTIVFTLLGVALSLYNVLRQINKINDEN
jgi:F0F1-type ATP synthase assembly protein I